MKWFGDTWHAPINDTVLHTETPVGELCLRCEVPIAEGDSGLILPHVGKFAATENPFHRQCFFEETGIAGIVAEEEGRIDGRS